MYHYRPKRKIYKSYPRPKACTFCSADEYGANLVSEAEHTRIIRNRTPYDIWELRDVTDHLMVVPKQHTADLRDISDAAQLEIIKVIAEYEAAGYNVYARGRGSSTRSVEHQHTHLIKTNQKIAHGSLTLMKPYVVLKF